MEMEDRHRTDYFLELIKQSKRGKFKLYIGMSAGVGKTFRMLQDAHLLQARGMDVKIGFIETHGRAETEALLAGLPQLSRRKLFYSGKELEELDVDAVIQARPELVLIDELAHTNIAGSQNEKRWQDVLQILAAGINVLSAVNIQHLESLHDAILTITGVDVQERIPDSVVDEADEVVHIDLTVDELITRLQAGKIYAEAKIQAALHHFFTNENLLQLRELALKEVASQVQRKVECEVVHSRSVKKERFLACISTNEKTAKSIIRKTARLAGYYNSVWYVLYVQLPKENVRRIALDKQRHLINNFKLATELGAEIIKVEGRNVPREIMLQCEQRRISTVCIGKPHITLGGIILAGDTFRILLNKLTQEHIDLVILS